MKKIFTFLLLSMFLFSFSHLFSIPLAYCSDDFDDYYKVTPKSFSFGIVSKEDIITFSFTIEALMDPPFPISYENNGYDFITIDGKKNGLESFEKGIKHTANCELNPKNLQSGNHEFSIRLLSTSVMHNFHVSLEIPITLTIKPSPAKLYVSISSLDFGMVKEEISETKKVLVKNDGEEVLKVDLSVDNDWIEISDYSIFLDKNQGKTISVNVTKNPPEIRGAFTGFLSVKSNGGTKKIQINAVFVKEVVIKLNIGSRTAYIDYKKITLDAPPEIYKSRTIVPLRFIGEAFGAEVEWEASTSTIDIYFPLKQINIRLRIGNNYAEIDNKRVNLEIPPIIKNGRTLVPIRFIVEAFGANVDWNAKTQGITITLAF